MTAFWNLARLSGADRCHLEHRTGNVAAERLYASLGFKPVGRRPSYYPGGVDAVLLTLAAEAAVEGR